MRAWTNSGKAVASSTPKASVAKRDRVANHSARIAANSPIAPISAGTIRHPIGRSPNTAMPSAISSLPSGGCSGLARCDRSSSARAAGR